MLFTAVKGSCTFLNEAEKQCELFIMLTNKRLSYSAATVVFLTSFNGLCVILSGCSERKANSRHQRQYLRILVQLPWNGMLVLAKKSRKLRECLVVCSIFLSQYFSFVSYINLCFLRIPLLYMFSDHS